MTEKIYTHKGKQYKVQFVDRKELYPFFGRAFMKKGYAMVRNDLPSLIKNFVVQHELYHLRDKNKWWGVFGREFRANLIPGLTNPIGLIACICFTLFNKDRRELYKDRFKRNY